MCKKTKNLKKHILVVSQYFYPEQFRINNICIEWVKRGFEVTVVTGIPNYPKGTFYEGYGWFQSRKEEYKGIHIIRIPLIARGMHTITLAINYISFVISGFFWKIFTKVKADKVFIFGVSPMTQALIGVWYAKKRKIPCYLYVQDLWPENVETVTGIHNSVIVGMINHMVNYIYRNCSGILATSPSFVKRIEERDSAFAEGKSKVFYWPQYAEEFYQPIFKEKARLVISDEEVPRDDIFKIVFTGNIGYAQGLDILPKVAVELRLRGIEVAFYIIGDGRYRENFEMEIRQNQVEEMFHLLGQKKAEDIPNYMALMDAAFLSFADNPLFEMTIPAKLQSYLACGKPILAVASGETKTIIDESQCGYCCERGNVERLVEAILNLKSMDKVSLSSIGMRGLKYYKQYFNKDALLSQVEVFMDI